MGWCSRHSVGGVSHRLLSQMILSDCVCADIQLSFCLLVTCDKYLCVRSPVVALSLTCSRRVCAGQAVDGLPSGSSKGTRDTLYACCVHHARDSPLTSSLLPGKARTLCYEVAGQLVLPSTLTSSPAPCPVVYLGDMPVVVWVVKRDGAVAFLAAAAIQDWLWSQAFLAGCILLHRSVFLL